MVAFIQKIGDSFQNAFMSLLVWREHHVKEKTFVIVLALLVGVLGGVAALVLYTLVQLL